MAPPFANVPSLVKDLFAWLADSEDPVLIKSCVFHYEFEFIHPFPDGNGRTGRLWQTALLGSWRKEFYGAPVIVISLRTATTLVVTDKNGAFRGGAILPGVKLGYGALADGTSLLPEIAVLPPKKVVGANTVDAMRSGAVFGTAALIDGMLERMEAELGYPCKAVATGGLAREVIPCCTRRDILVDPDLMLRGLWILYTKNR